MKRLIAATITTLTLTGCAGMPEPPDHLVKLDNIKQVQYVLDDANIECDTLTYKGDTATCTNKYGTMVFTLDKTGQPYEHVRIIVDTLGGVDDGVEAATSAQNWYAVCDTYPANCAKLKGGAGTYWVDYRYQYDAANYDSSESASW